MLTQATVNELLKKIPASVLQRTHDTLAEIFQELRSANQRTGKFGKFALARRLHKLYRLRRQRFPCFRSHIDRAHTAIYRSEESIHRKMLLDIVMNELVSLKSLWDRVCPHLDWMDVERRDQRRKKEALVALEQMSEGLATVEVTHSAESSERLG